MLLWNFFDFSKWSLKELEAASGQKSKETNLLYQRSFLAGRLALQRLLQDKGLSLEITTHEKFGFLILKDGFGSIAHTEQVCVAVVSSEPVGIDIESTQRMASHILAKIASPDEIEKLNLFQNELSPLIKDKGLFLWTAKEAFSKAIGLGLRKGVQDLKIHLMGESPYQTETKLQSPMNLREPVISFLSEEKYLISLCYQKDLEAKRLRLNR